MLLLCLCTLIGAYSLAIIPILPPPIVFRALLIATFGFSPLPKMRPVTCFLIGFIAIGFAASVQRADQLDDVFQGASVTFSAEIKDFPTVEADSIRFLANPLDRDDLPRRIRLSWFRPAAIPSIGETWRLHVRLKKPRGYANPGGFDFEGWLFRQRIGATGYVEEDSHSYRILGEKPGLLDRMRARFVTRVTSGLPADDATAVLMAIGVGARHAINREQWELYARTGTSHLMAISGLHIGLAASCAYLICWTLFAPLCSRRNLRDVAIVGAILAALMYASLSGFAVPARRALLMVLVTGLVLLFRQRTRLSLSLAIPCLVVFFTDPLAILAPGFKLSFAAVAILFLVASQHVRSVQPHYCRWAGTALTAIGRLARLQLALLAGLFPLTVLVFGRSALLAPLINMLVLPVFNFVTVPLTLLGAVLDGPFAALGSRMLMLAHSSVSSTLGLVTMAGEMEIAAYRTRQLGFLYTLVALVPLVSVLLPPGWPGRKLAIVAMAAVLVYRPAPPPAACLDYHVLDVGQGLAVVLRTSNHALLFDTGPSFRNGSDTGDLVILPFLHGLGIDRLDRLVISHADLDHAGGAKTVVAGVEVGDILVGEALPHIDRIQERCVAGDRWHWDAVGFAILHPRRNAPWNRNNSSCVLQVEVGRIRLLLTGDIESPAEKLLVHRGTIEATDVVVVPHHGSRTSSSKEFVNTTGAVLAIVSSGYQNRWGFPKPDVTARWRAAGADVLNTADMGAVSQRLCRDDGARRVRLQRLVGQKYWRESPPGRP